MSILDKLTNSSKKGKGRKKGSSDKEKVKKKVVRKKRDGDEELDELIDFSDIEGMMNGKGAPASDGDIDAESSGLDTRLTALEEKIVQIDGSIKSTRTSLSGVNDRMESMENNILKLLSVYEVVKRDINPFIGEKGSEKKDSEDPASLDIEGAELIKTPDVTDDLDGLDLGSDILFPEDTEEEAKKTPPKEEEDSELSLFDLPEELEEEEPEPEPPKPEPRREPEPQDHTPYSMAAKNGGSNMRNNDDNVNSFEPPDHLVNGGPAVSHNGKVLLETISHDYRTVILVLRWIEYMFERVTRDKISSLLDYYKDIGWISPRVKSHIMAYARGEVQNIFKYEPPENEDVLLDDAKSPSAYKKVGDWRLSADDHLKSLLFITKIAGIEVNKDTFNSLEEDIKVFTRTLEGYHGV